MLNWFDDDRERGIAAGIAIVVSSAWGTGFGLSYADLELISKLSGNLLAKAIQVVGLALAAFAIFYGWVLFVAGWAVSLVAALWIKEKAEALERAGGQ